MKCFRKNTMKKLSTYKKGLLIYIAVLLVILIALDVYVWIKLSDYQKLMESKESTYASGERVTPTVTGAPGTPTPTQAPTNTPTPTPAPETIILEIPQGVTVNVNDEPVDLSGYEATVVETDEFEVLYEFSDLYSEYADIESRVEIPSIYRYELQVLPGAVVSAENAAGEELELTSSVTEENITKYSHGFISSQADYDTITGLAFDALKKYSLFCTNDGEASALSPYFPANSEYLRVISSLDNSWYMRHSGLPIFSEEKVLNYVGYSDSLVYVELYMKQTILSSITGTNVVTEIVKPIWFVKLDGEWKIGAMEF